MILKCYIKQRKLSENSNKVIHLIYDKVTDKEVKIYSNSEYKDANRDFLSKLLNVDANNLAKIYPDLFNKEGNTYLYINLPTYSEESEDIALETQNNLALSEGLIYYIHDYDLTSPTEIVREVLLSNE